MYYIIGIIIVNNFKNGYKTKVRQSNRDSKLLRNYKYTLCLKFILNKYKPNFDKIK